MPPSDPAGRPRVIFQGELGAYGETAIVQHFGVDRAVPVPCDNFESVRKSASADMDIAGPLKTYQKPDS